MPCDRCIDDSFEQCPLRLLRIAETVQVFDLQMAIPFLQIALLFGAL